MQYGKGAEAGASFNNPSQTFFGSKGTKNFLVKLTTVFAILFFTNCFIIGLLNHKFKNKNTINMLEQEEVMTKQRKALENTFEDIPLENIK